jgi:hypothetical protein
VRGGRFVVVEQDEPAHLVQCAEVMLRTSPGTFEATPDVGLRDLLFTTSPTAPVILEALRRFVPQGAFDAVEDESQLADRIRRVAVNIRSEGD